MRTGITTRKQILMAALVVLPAAPTSLLHAQPTSRPAKTAKPPSDATPPDPASGQAPVPPELWQAYLDGLQGKPLYEVMRALSPELVEPALERWSQDLQRKITFGANDWWTYVSQFVGRVDERRGGVAYPAFGNSDTKRLAERVHPLLRVDVGDRGPIELVRGDRGHERPGKDSIRLYDSETGAAYLIDPDLRESLAFPILYFVRIQHPFHQRIEVFQAKNESLTNIVEQLSKMAGIDYDYAINSALSDSIRLTLKLKGKSIERCLGVAASVANWEVSFYGFRERNRKPAIPSIYLHEVIGVLEDRDRINLESKPDPPIETPLDALRFCVFRAVEKMKNDKSIVVSLRPKLATAEQEKK